MKTRDWLLVGGGALLLYWLWRKGRQVQMAKQRPSVGPADATVTGTAMVQREPMVPGTQAPTGGGTSPLFPLSSPVQPGGSAAAAVLTAPIPFVRPPNIDYLGLPSRDLA